MPYEGIETRLTSSKQVMSVTAVPTTVRVQILMCEGKTFYGKWIIFTVVCRWVGVERRDICIAGRVGSGSVVISDARQYAALPSGRY